MGIWDLYLGSYLDLGIFGELIYLSAINHYCLPISAGSNCQQSGYTGLAIYNHRVLYIRISVYLSVSIYLLYIGYLDLDLSGQLDVTGYLICASGQWAGLNGPGYCALISVGRRLSIWRCGAAINLAQSICLRSSGRHNDRAAFGVAALAGYSFIGNCGQRVGTGVARVCGRRARGRYLWQANLYINNILIIGRRPLMQDNTGLLAALPQ